MKILVIGGTGTVGSLVVHELLARGAQVSVLTRDEGKAKRLPTGVSGVVGDLLDLATIRSAFAGHDGVFLLNFQSLSEAHEGLMAVAGARLGGVRRIAYLSIHHLERAPHLPHFGAKIPVEMAVKASGMEWTILRPNNFYQNDLFFKDALFQYGVYPQPIGGIGLSRVDVRDIAEAAAVALTTAGHDGQVYNLVGPDVLTGESTAATWGEVLGRAIRYGGEDMNAWEAQAVSFFPAYLAFDFRLMYEFFQREGLMGTPEDIARQTRLLGHAPRSFAAFAAETAAMWKG